MNLSSSNTLCLLRCYFLLHGRGRWELDYLEQQPELLLARDILKRKKLPLNRGTGASAEKNKSCVSVAVGAECDSREDADILQELLVPSFSIAVCGGCCFLTRPSSSWTREAAFFAPSVGCSGGAVDASTLYLHPPLVDVAFLLALLSVRSSF